MKYLVLFLFLITPTIEADEIKGVNETLDAAAFTYVAAFISSLGWLLYMLAQRR